ncbi:MAG: glycosyltransferase family 4 protein [Pseudomonadales bacterium]
MADSGKKLLFIVNDADFFISHRLPIALQALKSGFEVHLACPPAGSLDGVIAAGITHHSCSLSRSGLNPVSEFRSYLQLRRIVRQLNPDIVHLVTIKPVIYGSIIARMAGVPCTVAAISGLGYSFIDRSTPSPLNTLIVWLYRIALHSPGIRVVFQNQDDLDLFDHLNIIDRRQATLIPGSGVDIRRFSPAPTSDNSSSVILAARLLVDKGIREFVEAGAIVRRTHPQTRFVLVGGIDPGNPAAIPEHQITRWVDAGVVEWWGHRSDMPEVLSAARIVVLPSYREGMPKILAEAAAMGIAIVTTDVPGCRDSIIPEETGLLVPPRDSESLAAAISALLEDPIRARQMGVAGRRLAEAEFSVERIVDLNLALYRIES